MALTFISKSDNRLSSFRTQHFVANYAEFHTVEEFAFYIRKAREMKLVPFVLGKGSNTYFSRRRIQSAILKNRLSEEITILRETESTLTVEISSSVSIIKALRFCLRHSLDSFYYLASAPGNIGGALAMNAGGARKPPLSIYDYVDQVTWWENGSIKTVPSMAIPRDYRWTPFTGIHDKLIIGAQFTFPKNPLLKEDMIQTRMEWYRKFQDPSGPSCGSVFKLCNGYIMGALKRLGVGVFGSKFSRRCSNWIICENGSPYGIGILISLAILLHRIFGKKIEIELIKIT